MRKLLSISANAGAILKAVPLEELHASCDKPIASRGDAVQRFGFAEATRRVCNAEAVVALKAEMRAFYTA